MKIELTHEQIELIKSCSNMVYDDANKWYHIPYYFKELENGTIELFFFNDLPEHIKKYHEELKNR